MTLHNNNGTLVIHNPECEYDYAKLVEEWKDKMDELPGLPGATEEQKNASLVSDAEHYLIDTDWYVVRFAESGKEMPEEVKTKRQEARETISKLRA